MSKNYRFVWGIVAIAVMAIRLGPTSADDKSAPRFEITPKVWFVGDPKLDIRLVNVPPNQKVTVVGQVGNQVSRIEGIADDKGQVDLRGSYEPGPTTGAPFSILWDIKEEASVKPIKEPSLFKFRAEIDGKPIATGTLQRDFGNLQEPKVTFGPVNEPGLSGDFFLPPGKGPFPGVIVFGGSEGGNGMPRFQALALGRHGFACLALAYFDSKEPQVFPGLPKQLKEIPLEYFEKAIGWMKEHNQVRGDRLAVMGASRGGELALLLGSMFPDVKAVVAFAPSHVAWSSWPVSAEDREKKQNRPVWTYKDKPVPFMSRLLSPEEEKKLKEKNPHDRRPLYAEWLKDEEAVRKATIPVEKTAGPILLITGTDDWMCPAAEMAGEVIKRLAAKEHPFRRQSQHLRYEGCGHSIRLPLGQPSFGVVNPNTKDEISVGGNPKAASYAAWDSWPKVVKFLSDSLK